MNINFKEIYPKSWELFKNEYSPILEDMNNAIAYNPESSELCNKKEDIINAIFYAITEKFFDEQGIIIEILINSSTYQNIYDEFCWYFIIQIKKVEENKFEGFVEIKDLKYSTRTEAKEQAIIKAFEILENKLKGE